MIENYAINLMNFSNNVNAMGNLFNVHQISRKKNLSMMLLLFISRDGACLDF